ncbi:unnamed protein product [marine sediment metagenome]|uniref:Uncharacterized protein n=1 Tax=marine sediment metagenome TaxID=412755 RepID=X1EGX3_9ZZZZ
MALENWVKLPVGKVVCMRFKEYRVTPREITDPFWKTPRTVESLLFLVSHVDGKPVDKTFSVVSEKLALEFKPYLEDGSYRGYEWCLVKDAPGFVAPRIAKRTRI